MSRSLHLGIVDKQCGIEHTDRNRDKLRFNTACSFDSLKTQKGSFVKFHVKASGFRKNVF